ncbi:MAG: hypothetical protein WCH75_19520, partial [Candidatus Binatia bacterium]
MAELMATLATLLPRKTVRQLWRTPMTENLLETVGGETIEEKSSNDEAGDSEISQRPGDVPDKFWDNESGQIRTDALVKSYLELERKLGSTARREPPPAPEDYAIDISNDFLSSDPEVNKRLHAAGFSEDQAQVVYDLAGEHLVPMISDLASVFEAEQQTERLVNHFGGHEKWGLTARQIDTWARSQLPSHVMEALSTTYEGVLA